MEYDEVISLRDYVTILGRQAWLIVATVVLITASAIGASAFQTPVYEAHAEVLVESDSPQTERVLVTSHTTAEAALSHLDLSPAPALDQMLASVRAEVVPAVPVIRIIASDSDPDRASAIANAFAEAYLQVRRERSLEELETTRAHLEQRAAQLSTMIQALDDVAATSDNGVPTTGTGPIETWMDRDVLLTQFIQISSQIARIDEQASLADHGVLLRAAVAPNNPISPRPMRTAALALVLGLLLGVGGAFLRDHLADRVRDEIDLKRTSGGRPVLARIPEPAGSRRDRSTPLGVSDPLVTEACHELSAVVRSQLRTKREPRADRDTPTGWSILISSVGPHSRGPHIAAHFASAVASLDLRTVLVEADLRAPRIAREFGIDATSGLADVLETGTSVTDHSVQINNSALTVVPAGIPRAHPHGLLAGRPMQAVHEELTGSADLVIYVVPSLQVATDALEFADIVDLAVLVVEKDVSSRKQVATAIDRMEQVGIDVAGTVLTGVDAPKRRGSTVVPLSRRS